VPIAERRRALFAALVAVLVLTLPGIALARDGKDKSTDERAEQTTEKGEAPEPAEVLSTLPVLGAGLNITIGRDEEGAIASIALDPDTATIVKESDHYVVFLLEDGDTKVLVKSGKGYVQTSVRADDTADVAGDGAWSADVFGSGDIVVPYSTAFDGITPTITLGAITVPDGVTAEVGEPWAKTSDDADKAYAKVKVELASDDQKAVLSLTAKTYVNDEGETKVEVSATLSSRDRVKCRNGRWRDWDDRRGDRDWDSRRWDHERDHRRGDRDRHRDRDSGGTDDG